VFADGPAFRDPPRLEDVGSLGQPVAVEVPAVVGSVALGVVQSAIDVELDALDAQRG
jgi:hypothetical protein